MNTRVSTSGWFRLAALTTLVVILASLMAVPPVNAEQLEARNVEPTLRRGTPEPTGTRISGDTAIATANALAIEQFGTADTVLLSRSDQYADALAGSLVAKNTDAPILFTEPAALSDGVLETIKALGAENIIILGGPVAVSNDVAIALLNEGLKIRRISGENRFETALAIANEYYADGVPPAVFFVEGRNDDPQRGWPDAISVTAVAGAMNAPIIPVESNKIEPVIAEQWATWQDAGTDAYIIGGPVAISEDTATALQNNGDELTRLYGDGRYTTSETVYQFSVSEQSMDPSFRYLIPGTSFVEGLAAGIAGVHTNNPVVMIAEDIDHGLRAGASNLDTLEGYAIVGGETVISSALETKVTEAMTPVTPAQDSCITLLHHNDGESQILGTGDNNHFGSLARLVTLANQEQAAAAANGCTPLTVTSGDNFLAGPELNASNPNNTDLSVNVLDAVGMSLVGYDAIDIGNHDTDFGPDFLARFISSFDPAVPFLSSNLDVSNVPSLQGLADQGRVLPSTVVERDGTKIGIIGLTTPMLRTISSPGLIVVKQEITQIVQDEIDAMTNNEVNHVILISHLQGLSADYDLIGQLSGVDVVVAGGGDEILSNPGDPLVPGDMFSIAGTYPLLVEDKDGNQIPTVTTAGDYKYLGRLTLYFDAEGKLLADTPYDHQTSRMIRVADESLPGGVARNQTVVTDVEAPIEASIAALESNVLATSEVALEGSRPAIRNQETNLGNLVADAHRYVVQTQGDAFGVDTTQPIVGMQNGGGIRNNNLIPAGQITEATTFDILPFNNFITAVEGMDVEKFKTILERAYYRVEGASGAFAHLSENVTVEIDLTQTAQVVSEGANGDIVIDTAGERVRSLTIDGTDVITDGQVVNNMTFTLATIDFSARNGDAYPFNLAADEMTLLGMSYQQSLASYIADDTDGLGGTISAADYPEAGTGRITITQ